MPPKTLIASRLKPAAPVSLTSRPSSRLADPVADRLHGGLELVPDAVAGLHRLDDDRGCAVAREDRFLRLQDERRRSALSFVTGLVDARLVGVGEPALALEHDHRRRELAARELLDGLERLHGLRVRGQERRATRSSARPRTCPPGWRDR